MIGMVLHLNYLIYIVFIALFSTFLLFKNDIFIIIIKELLMSLSGVMIGVTGGVRGFQKKKSDKQSLCLSPVLAGNL
ncbi:hypothetical protein [Serratia quinivorans]|uniref:hypothetical protein n=1 Tax=Serratia quinivorans TaxID=137545 RepID=UPI002E795D19|nr:hypothetical protein [Serratia quinivorans]